MNRRQFTTRVTLSAVALASPLRLAAADARPFRVAVIGHTGRGGYGHGLDVMWQKIPQTEIVAVADADSAGLRAARTKLGGVPGFADYRKMLAETKPDLVAICPRYVDQHRDMCLAAIESGARGIYIEKPFCRAPAEADEILAAAELRKVKIAVAHRNRFHPVLPVLRKLIADGAIGRMLEIRGRGKEDSRGGSLDLWVLGSHLFNLATVFAGKPLAGTATVLQDGRPVVSADIKEGDEGVGPLAGNEVHARFEMERGLPVFFDSIAKAGNAAAGFGIQVIGTQGILDLRIDKEPLAHLLPGSPFQPVEEPRNWVSVSSAGVGKSEPITGLATLISDHIQPARDLLAAIRENRDPLCSARDGATTVEMISAVFESHRLGGQRVTLPLKTRQNPLALL